MCGIAGIVNGRNNSQRPLWVGLEHRGPDAHDSWSDACVSLAHTRLSIIDLDDRSNQPMEKGGLVLVYNGEIYNYKALRDDLVSTGVAFRTTSDSEVVIELFRQYGMESFAKLEGMFAFCLYDIRRKAAYLVRDYFGIKPLFYTQKRSGEVVFASELKALAPFLDKRNLNMRALVSTFNYLWVDTYETMFEGVYKLPPAHYIEIEFERTLQPLVPQRYWSLPEYQHTSEKTIQELETCLEESIERHLVSDVPVGAFLSGGLDSSLICALAKKYNPDITTYTISISEKDKRVEKMPDDNAYAKVVAQYLGLNHTDIPVSADIAQLLPQIVYSLDEPIGDPAAINTFLIAKAARERGIKVLLSGMGADELFGGYRRHYAVLLANNCKWLPYKLLRKVSDLIPVQLGVSGLRITRWLKRYLSFAHLPLDEAYMRSYSYYDRDALAVLLHGQCNEYIDDMCSYHKTLFGERYQNDPVNQMCFTDIHMFMRGLNLTYTDRASMAASVEVRVPFIDREVVSCAMDIPGNLKIRGNVQKYILKKVAEKYLPKNIVHRPKASFGMPIRAWMSQDLKGMVDELLSERQIKKRGVLNGKMVRKMIDEDRRGVNDYAYQIYQFLTFELWCQAFLDK